MRVVKKNFNGLVCGQFLCRSWTALEGVMEYELGQPRFLYIPAKGTTKKQVHAALSKISENGPAASRAFYSAKIARIVDCGSGLDVPVVNGVPLWYEADPVLSKSPNAKALRAIAEASK